MTTTGSLPMSCTGCKYCTEQRLCDYASETGRTRLGTIMQELGTDHGAEWREAIKPKNCGLWKARAKGVFRRKASSPPLPSRKDADGHYYHRLVERDAKALMRRGYTNKQIAALKQWNPADVEKFRKQYDANAKRMADTATKGRATKFEEARRYYYVQGLSDSKIAELLGTSTQDVANWRNRNNLPPTLSAPRKFGDGFLVEDYSDEIMALYKAGMSDVQIGMAIGCHRTSIGKWRRQRGLPANGARYDDRPSD